MQSADGVRSERRSRARRRADLFALGEERAGRIERADRIVSDIAHDLNNLIMTIFGHCDALERGLESGGVDPRRIEAIREEATRAATLSRRLTDLSRRPQLRAVEVNLNRQILDLEELLRRLVPAGVGLSLALDPDVRPIRIDPVQLGHVVVGLVMNACDAMPDGGPLRVTTRNVVSEDGATRRAEIAVRCADGAFEVQLPTV